MKTTIITGTLGSGKTSLICKLIQAKPPDEKWAIIVNEFGSLGIDGALLEGNAGAGVSVRQLAGKECSPEVSPATTRNTCIAQLSVAPLSAGGCLCCQAAGMLTPAIAQILRATKPHRLIIEPSGLGHPVGEYTHTHRHTHANTSKHKQTFTHRHWHTGAGSCVLCKGKQDVCVPAGLMQVLQSEHLGPSIDLQAIVCLVSADLCEKLPILQLLCMLICVY